MNVYVQQLSRALGELGVQVDIFTREHDGLTNAVEWIAPAVRVVHLPAGPPDAGLASCTRTCPGSCRSSMPSGNGTGRGAKAGATT